MEFTNETKTIASEIINLSQLLSHKMETWRDVAKRKQDSTTYQFSAGFTMKDSESEGVQLVADIQLEPADNKALLRASAIEMIEDENDRPRFNNIQLTYRIDNAHGQQVTKQDEEITSQELVTLLEDSTTQLDEVIISDLTGRDSESGEALGKRYEFTANDIAETSGETHEEIITALQTVLSRLHKSAEAEASTKA